MRAATSVSLTIGVAFATLVVVGGILAGPAILDCSHQSGGIGACLRGKVVQSGLLPPTPASSELPVVSVEVSSSASTTVAKTPPRTPGWIEANATEYEAPPPSLAALSPLPGVISGQGSAALGNGSEAVANIAAPSGAINAEGGAAAINDPAAQVALVEPAGKLRASGAATVLPDTLPAMLTPNPGAPAAAGSIGGNVAPLAAATLEAELTPPAQIVPEPVVAPPPTPVLPAPKLVPRPAPVAKAAPIAKPKTGPIRVLKYDPRYPSVTVLPPPNTGSNSSFATLELR